jgi:hypothetical protein
VAGPALVLDEAMTIGLYPVIRSRESRASPMRPVLAVGDTSFARPGARRAAAPACGRREASDAHAFGLAPRRRRRGFS